MLLQPVSVLVLASGGKRAAPRLRPGVWHMAVGPTLQHDRSDFPCEGALSGGFTSAQVRLCWALRRAVSRHP